MNTKASNTKHLSEGHNSPPILFFEKGLANVLDYFSMRFQFACGEPQDQCPEVT